MLKKKCFFLRILHGPKEEFLWLVIYLIGPLVVRLQHIGIMMKELFFFHLSYASTASTRFSIF